LSRWLRRRRRVRTGGLKKLCLELAERGGDRQVSGPSGAPEGFLECGVRLLEASLLFLVGIRSVYEVAYGDRFTAHIEAIVAVQLVEAPRFRGLKSVDCHYAHEWTSGSFVPI